MDSIRFDNNVHYMVVNEGVKEQEGWLKNAVGGRVKDQITRSITTPAQTQTGTLIQLNFMSFRTDGSALLGTKTTWSDATAISTRYSNSTYVTSVALVGTYGPATANVTVKTVALVDQNWSEAGADTSDAGSFCGFYSTSFNLSVGSGGYIIVNWTISVS